MNEPADVVIVGSGLAGLMTAHLLADHMNVIIITKSNVETSNSSRAQGGMAAALGEFDHWKNHFQDTLEAGQHHHHFENLELIVRRAPEMVRKLQRLGVVFDSDQNGGLALGMEGAHKSRRIVHAGGDQTGKVFIEALMNAVKDRVTIYEQMAVTNLLVAHNEVIGVQTAKQNIYARATVLATGGCGQLYTHTSNVDEATGDGFALAYRAGANLDDMEFIQFHPTLFINEGRSYGLISEAVRGEGAVLVDSNGNKVMASHPLRDLAPRDVVSRTIHAKLQEGGDVYLDCRHLDHLQQEFPSLHARCQKLKLDHLVSHLPVAPGAHFISGGIETNCHGETSLNRLYAVGEVACTGVHGANRLASNSLLEGLVFAEQTANHILNVKRDDVNVQVDEKVFDCTVNEEPIPTKEEIKRKMTAFVGIEREELGLTKMKKWLERYLNTALSVQPHEEKDRLERKNMILTAYLITTASLYRTESRGGHFRHDYPMKRDEDWSHIWINQTKDDGLSFVNRNYVNVM